MKIISIIIYPDKLKTTLKEGDAQEKTLQETIYPLSQLVNSRFGTHTLKMDNHFFYAYIIPQKTVLVAADEEINFQGQTILFDKLLKIKNKQELNLLINAPEDAIKSKAQKVLQEINKTKEIAFETVHKLQERQEKIEHLKQTTDTILHTSHQFKNNSTKLKYSFMCPGLFFFWSTIRNFFQKNHHPEYDYQPAPRQTNKRT